MSERLEEAIGELKRADHMIYVSLKYTRTVDVIKNILERLISCSDFTFDYLVEHLKETKKIEELPVARTKKMEVLTDYFKNSSEFMEYLDFYLLLRKIDKANFTRRQEFRRHVTMTAILDDNKIVELNIDSIHEYYNKTKAFVDFAITFVSPKE
jgi:hypothetical protein